MSALTFGHSWAAVRRVADLHGPVARDVDLDVGLGRPRVDEGQPVRAGQEVRNAGHSTSSASPTRIVSRPSGEACSTYTSLGGPFGAANTGLVSDLVGFTSISASLPPDVLV